MIYDRFDHCADKVKAMPTDTNGKEEMKILDINNNILDFNKQNQQWSGLKLLTPNQMLSRLPIFLAQLNTGNN